MPKITSEKKTTQRRFTEMRGDMHPVNKRHNGDREPLTLADLKAFVMAAEDAEVPADTAVSVPGAFFLAMVPLTRIYVGAEVEG